MTNQRTPWTTAHYSPLVTGSGAAKLAASGIAPLVAAARGYGVFSDPEAAKVVAKKSSLATGAVALRTKLVAMVANDDSDVLTIPWFGLGAVVAEGRNTRSRTTQLRPSHPLINAQGKPAKYEFLPGESTKLDVNPATPSEWITSGHQILMTEGVLKGDSALTALLRSAGISDAALTIPVDPAEARSALEILMLGVPVADRVPIVSFAGVANWASQADWRSVQLRDRRVIVAFDGDATTNFNVYKQAALLFDFVTTKGGTPSLLNLGSLEAEVAKLAAGVNAETKLGIDDYLAQVGDWAGALSLIQADLPPEPMRADNEMFPVGTWRVNPESEYLVEELAGRMGPDGSMGEPFWQPRTAIGGRIHSIEELRIPSRQEIRTGVIADHISSVASSSCVLELHWLDPATGEERSGTVTGPTDLLAYSPNDWDRKGASVPDEVLMHPEWPPRFGQQWLSAIKAHRTAEIQRRSAWDAMGWVPVKGGHPAFIIGGQVLGKTVEDEQRTVPGVTELVLSNSSKFGVIDTYAETSTEEYKAQVLADIEAVLDGYIEAGAWADRFSAAAAVGAMYRPTIPAPVTTSMYIYGPPRAGKSFHAAHMMGGWQCTLGTWSISNLPGSAGDTLAFVEFALARTVIWVADDLAPSTNRQQAEAQEAKVGDLIRAVHNGAPRQKMDGSKGTPRPQGASSTLFIVTAENEPQVASVRERVIAVNTPEGAFTGGDAVAALDELISINGAPARLTAALIRFWLSDNEFGTTWAEKTAGVAARISELTRFAATTLEQEHGMRAADSTRHARIAAELAVTFEVLALLAESVGMSEDHPLMAKLGREEGAYMHDLFAGAARTIRSQRTSKPGRSLVSALRHMLEAGLAHIENPNTPGQPPVEAEGNGGPDEAARVAQLNRALGWVPDSSGVWMPKGQTLGFYGVTPRGGEKVVLFNAQNAFGLAKRLHPDRILGGTNANSSWNSVWGEGLCANRKKRDGVVTVEQKLGAVVDGEIVTGRIAKAGVPVLLDALLNEGFGEAVDAE